MATTRHVTVGAPPVFPDRPRVIEAATIADKIELDPVLTKDADFPTPLEGINLSTAVNFTRASGISVDIPNAGKSIASKIFNTSILDYSDTSEPTNLYTGQINTRALDGLSIAAADDANDIILTYSPPTPPNINLDVSIPTKPDFSILNLTLPSNNTSVSLLANLPDLFQSMEDIILALVEDVLGNLSTTEINALNNKVYSSSTSHSLMLRRIVNTSMRKYDVLVNRSKNTLASELGIISGQAKNSTIAAEALLKLNNEGSRANSILQQATIDNHKLNASIHVQNQVLAIMLYNTEIQSAQINYKIYEKLIQAELKKLEVYNKQISGISSALDGNSALVTAYKQQLSIIKQVFESFEASMKLSEIGVKLTTAQINVETDNIGTLTRLIDGEVDKSQSKIYQVKTQNSALNINNDAEMAKNTVDISVQKSEIAKDLLELDLNLKNALISIDNDVLKTIADAVKMQLENIKDLSGLDAQKIYNNVYLSFLSSNKRAVLKSDENIQGISDSHNVTSDKYVSTNLRDDILMTLRQASELKFDAFKFETEKRSEISQVLARANTIQTLNQIISEA